MKKRRTIILILTLLILIIILFGIIGIINKNSNNDGKKFKEEYEKLNKQSVTMKDISYNYLDINIPSDNPVKYLDKKDIVNKLTNGTNVIYFGSSTCNWCRAAVPVLLDTLKENKFTNIYYYDFFDLRDNYEKDKNKEDTKIYKQIINVLGDYIDRTFDEDSNKAGEKRLSAPFVVFIKDGKVVGTHYKTVETHTEYEKQLTNKQKEELKDIYQSLYNGLKNKVCNKEHEC